jgi:butyryl-CoA dehydrogenase
VYQVAWEADNGMPLKLLHAKAAVLKASCAEASNRVADRMLQVMGGRGYMRENPIERLYRDVRVDRIWEGSSEICRIVIANEINKRGLDDLINYPGFPFDKAEVAQTTNLNNKGEMS